MYHLSCIFSSPQMKAGEIKTKGEIRQNGNRVKWGRDKEREQDPLDPTRTEHNRFELLYFISSTVWGVRTAHVADLHNHQRRICLEKSRVHCEINQQEVLHPAPVATWLKKKNAAKGGGGGHEPLNLEAVIGEWVVLACGCAWSNNGIVPGCTTHVRIRPVNSLSAGCLICYVMW